MSESEQNTVDKGPFLGFDPIVIPVVIGKVEQRVESCIVIARAPSAEELHSTSFLA
jgi:hypothetical protein